jgi:chromosome segregation ATPase
MTRPVSPLFAAALVAVLVAPLMATPSAQAQNAPKTGSLGGGAGAGPVMTRDELRACLKQKDEIAARTTALDSSRKALEADKAAIVAETEALKAERGGIDSTRGSVESINAQQQKMSERIDDWNQRMKTFEEDGRTGPIAERMRRNLQREKAELEKESAALDAARGNTKLDPASAQRYNERAAAAEQKVVAWNQRNAAAVKETNDLLQEKDIWTSECANRRFREDDETAIKKGQ